MPLGRGHGNADSPRAVLPSDDAAVVDAVAVGASEPRRSSSFGAWSAAWVVVSTSDATPGAGDPPVPVAGVLPLAVAPRHRWGAGGLGRVLGLLFVHRTLSPAP
ncbi:hypothetical protein GTY87_39630 [Streptomyces sp. SID7813]|uniref:Uncharacterized protein n=1 Tax=Streptomyces coelicolor (strain ATCC BAA-471 / A3(2) / M145) TaxID=100226 RepID=Q9EWM5_STRCO|nr:hypothetical protein [Streptomyces sp. SID7813]QFI47471.1 hypothetical protein FQ762_40015 [Streptomyces coelicolor A3(2)]CAC14492.1 hypothetical protein [Streptomyces coelicolor A3(2)]